MSGFSANDSTGIAPLPSFFIFSSGRVGHPPIGHRGRENRRHRQAMRPQRPQHLGGCFHLRDHIDRAVAALWPGP
jgi:hypothetical protein